MSTCYFGRLDNCIEPGFGQSRSPFLEMRIVMTNSLASSRRIWVTFLLPNHSHSLPSSLPFCLQPIVPCAAHLELHHIHRVYRPQFDHITFSGSPLQTATSIVTRRIQHCQPICLPVHVLIHSFVTATGHGPATGVDSDHLSMTFPVCFTEANRQCNGQENPTTCHKSETFKRE